MQRGVAYHLRQCIRRPTYLDKAALHEPSNMVVKPTCMCSCSTCQITSSYLIVCISSAEARPCMHWDT